MPLATEVNPFQAEIGSNQPLVTGRDLQDGTVIPDARCNPFFSSCSTADARDEQFFGERQDGSIIYKRGGLGGAKYVGNVDIAEGQPLPPPIHPTEASDWWALLAVQ
jgi:hypothetical protein